MSGPVVLPVTPMSQNSTKFWPAFLLAMFLGIFGAHRFYLKSPKRGWMLLTLGGLGFWALIDIITILLGKFKDETGQTIVNPKPAVSWAIFVVVGAIGLANNDGEHSSGGSKGEPTSMRGNKGKSTVSVADMNDPDVKRLLAEIEAQKDKMETTKLTPPTTNQMFTLGTQYENLTRPNTETGLWVDLWTQTMEPTNHAVAAFRGWSFLLPDGKARIVYAKYIAYFNNTNDIEVRAFDGTWRLNGTKLMITPDSNVDPQHFSEDDGSVIFTLSKALKWIDTRREQMRPRKTDD